MANLKIGEKDPYFGIPVKLIVFDSEDVSIYLDNNYEIYYYASSDVNYCDRFNEIHSKVRRLEILVISGFSSKEKSNYNYLLGNILADTFESDNPEEILRQLDSIEKDILELSSNRLRNAFFLGSNIAGLLIVLVIILLYLFKIELQLTLTKTAYQFIFCSLFGGIGALVFNYSKLKNYNPSKVINSRLAFTEGAFRIFYGGLYGLIILLGIKSEIVFGSLSDSSSDFQLAFAATIAGASDTFIKAIVKSVEDKNTIQ